MDQQENNLSNLSNHSNYSGRETFNRLPLIANFDGEAVDVAILGIPFDGLVTYRPGARFGPKAIRQSSLLCRSYSQQMEVDVYKHIRAGDAGDARVCSFDYEETFRQIEARVSELHNKNINVVSLGGDHSILLPILRATARKHPNLTLIQFDAHSDISDATLLEGKYHHGTSVRHAIEEEVIKGSQVFQIGVRGYLQSVEYNDFAKQHGINILGMSGVHDPNVRESFMNLLRKTVGDSPCYLTFDIDGIDPAFAPGTGTPVVGGLTSFEALDMLSSLKGLRFIGGDVVEVAPVYDHAEITSLLGAAIAFEIMALIAIARRLPPIQDPTFQPML